MGKDVVICPYCRA